MYALDYNLEGIKNILRFDFDLVSKWFEVNYMVLNADKCHFMCLSKDTLSLIISSSITAMKKKYLGSLLTNKLLLKVTLKFYVKKPETGGY